MKISPTKNTKKRVAIIVLIILLVIGGIGAYLYTSKVSVDNKTIDSQHQEGNSSSNSSSNINAESNVPQNSIEEESPSADTLQASITALNQNGNILQIRVLIDGVFNEGSCKLTLTKDSTVVTKSADIQPASNNSTCKGFDVNIDELKQKGEWSISVAIATPTKSAVVTQTVMVK